MPCMRLTPREQVLWVKCWGYVRMRWNKINQKRRHVGTGKNPGLLMPFPGAFYGVFGCCWHAILRAPTTRGTWATPGQLPKGARTGVTGCKSGKCWSCRGGNGDKLKERLSQLIFFDKKAKNCHNFRHGLPGCIGKAETARQLSFSNFLVQSGQSL